MKTSFLLTILIRELTVHELSSMWRHSDNDVPSKQRQGDGYEYYCSRNDSARDNSSA